jgi:hypothetical protein
MLTRKLSCGSSLIRGRNAGSAKAIILLSLAACFLLIITVGVQRTTAEDCDCNVCHSGQHGLGWQGCATCHGFPPDTASHIRHFGASTVTGFYGDTSVTQDFDPDNRNHYQIGCGNCHPDA